jgi:hypothetical protein
VTRFDLDYASEPFLVRACIIGFCAFFGLLNLFQGHYVGRKMQSLYNRFNFYLGSLILGVGFIVWPPVFFLYGDATWGIAIVVGAGATIALGASLGGSAVRRERFLGSD